jgi:hypothetical protein|nr:MAG TPA: hypothetical protein [Bacteriophage sp.]
MDFIKYAKNELDTELDTMANNGGFELDSIVLEKVFPTKYKWFVRDVKLKALRSYLKEVESRIQEFQGGKEDNLRLLIGVHFLRFVLLTKLVTLYVSTYSEMKRVGLNVDNLTISEIGIGQSILKYILSFEEFDNKTIDDWLNLVVDSNLMKYYFSTMKRIMSILDFK